MGKKELVIVIKQLCIYTLAIETQYRYRVKQNRKKKKKKNEKQERTPLCLKIHQ